MPETGSAAKWKLAGAVVLLAGALLFVYGQYRSNAPPPPGDFRVGRDRGTAVEQRRAQQQILEQQQRRREVLYQQLNLTSEQRSRIEEIDQQYPPRSGPEANRARRQALNEILTPEQREQIREIREQRRAERGQERRPRPLNQAEARD